MCFQHATKYSTHNNTYFFQLYEKFSLPSTSTPRMICSIRPAFSGNVRRTWHKIATRSVTTLNFLRSNSKNCWRRDVALRIATASQNWMRKSSAAYVRWHSNRQIHSRACSSSALRSDTGRSRFSLEDWLWSSLSQHFWCASSFDAYTRLGTIFTWRYICSETRNQH